jgi:hypothetical protein
MKRFRNKAAVIILSWALVFPLEGIFSPAFAYIIILPQVGGGEAVPQVVTPLSMYATLSAKSIATTHKSGLDRMENSFQKNFPSGQFELFSTQDTPVGGIGFWLNPSHYGADDRYLGVCARMVIPESPFRDDVSGHIAAVMDRFGKPIMNELVREIEKIPEPSVKGVALVFIYSKDQIASPSFQQGAEAFALYISKEDLKLFCEFKMTLQALFNKSEIFMFQGQSQVQTLTSFFLQA